MRRPSVPPFPDRGLAEIRLKVDSNLSRWREMVHLQLKISKNEEAAHDQASGYRQFNMSDGDDEHNWTVAPYDDHHVGPWDYVDEHGNIWNLANADDWYDEQVPDSEQTHLLPPHAWRMSNPSDRNSFAARSKPQKEEKGCASHLH